MIRHKTILVPTDFRVASLNTLRWALEESNESTVDVVLLYCETLDDSITERLFYSPRRIIDGLLTADYKDAISILRNRFENKLGELRIELFHGKTQPAFDTLLNTLNIDAIYLSTLYRLHRPGRTFDPASYIKQGKVPYYEVAWFPQDVITTEDSLENLFL